MSEVVRHAWERELQHDIYDGNAGLRAVGRFDGGSLDLASILRTAEELGIDEGRVESIVRAAVRDVDWHDAVGDMVAHGVDQRSAAEIVDRIVVRTWAIRTWHDGPFNEAKQRRELAWSVGSICALVAGGALVAYYWSSVSSAWRVMWVCVRHIFSD